MTHKFAITTEVSSYAYDQKAYYAQERTHHKQANGWVKLTDNPNNAMLFDEKWQAVNMMGQLGDEKLSPNHRWPGCFSIEEVFIIDKKQTT